MKVQCRALNPNPTTVAAARTKTPWVAATIVWLWFLDTSLRRERRQGTKTGKETKTANEDRERRQGTKTGNQDKEKKTGN